MNALRLYQHFLALRKHFNTEKFSVFDCPKIDIPESKFFELREHKLWERLASQFEKPSDGVDYLVANLIYGNDTVVFEPELSKKNHTRWLKRKQSITKMFQDDLAKIPKMESHIILSLCFGNFISVETVIILNSIMGFLETNDSLVLFDDFTRRINKAKPFIKFDRERVMRVYEEWSEKEYEKV